MVLTRRQAAELQLTLEERHTVNNTVLTPVNRFTRHVDMLGSATKGVLSHPLVDDQPTAGVDGVNTVPSTSGIHAATTNMGDQENRLPTGQEPAVVDITYPLIEDMVALSDPDEVKAMVRQVESELQSSEWTTVCSGMNGLRRLAAHHPEACQELMGVAMGSIVRGIKSPRSALSKSAIITSRDLFMCVPETMGAHVECVEPGSLLTQLLLKSASLDKRFVVEEAVKSLEQMALSVHPLITCKSLMALGCHKNPKVRGKCYMILLLVMQSDEWQPNVVVDVGLDQLMRMCADGTNDNTAEARDSSRKILCMMRDEWILVDDVRAHMECCCNESSSEQQLDPSMEGIDPLLVRYLSVVLGASKATLLLKKMT